MTIEASAMVIDNATTVALSHPAVREVRGRPFDQVRRRRVVDHDVAFILFGPDYAPRRATRRVVGFADITSLHPESAMSETLAMRLRFRARRRMSRARFDRYERVVVEAGHVARTLDDQWGLPADRLSIVPNTLNGVFLDEQAQESLPAVVPAGATFCYPTRAHPHKNLAVLGPAAQELRARHQIDVRFVLTLSDREWTDLPEDTRRHSVNVGPLRIAQVPALYRACSGAVFPSLAECFSAAPLEAIASRAPLVASKRDFVQEVVGKAAAYFEPTDPVSLASALAETLTDHDQRTARVELGHEIARAWPTARDRARRYAELITREAELA
jgi:glycosyltransferase involved in cell wall biosynthesis